MRRRVVITGMGVITPLGHTVGELFASQVEGRTAVGPITRFDARTFPTTFASEVKGFELGKYIRDAASYRNCGLNTSSRWPPASRRLEDAGLLDPTRGDRSRMGVYLGSGEGSDEFPELSAGIAEASPKDAPGPVNAAVFTRMIGVHARRAAEGEQEMYTPGRARRRRVRPRWARTRLARPPAPPVRRPSARPSTSSAAGDADVMLAGGSHSMIHPLGHQRLQPPHRPLAAQRQPADRKPALRPHPRRLRHRRGGGAGRPGRTRAREEARGTAFTPS